MTKTTTAAAATTTSYSRPDVNSRVLMIWTWKLTAAPEARELLPEHRSEVDGVGCPLDWSRHRDDGQQIRVIN